MGSMDDVVKTPNGESLEVKGIQNACVAQCAWFLDGHIRAIREHYEHEIDRLKKQIELLDKKYSASNDCIQKIDEKLGKVQPISKKFIFDTICTFNYKIRKLEEHE